MEHSRTEKQIMKAVTLARYGSPAVLELSEVAMPQPKDDELLIRVKATAVNSADWRLRRAAPVAVRLFFGLMRPKKPILGGVLSGEVVRAGKNVKTFKAGDPVFGSTGMRFGAYAEYICLPASGVLALKPEHISHEEAAVIPFGATTALHFLKKARIQPGQRVLINGASGAVGTAAVQLAKHFGAHVTGVCSTANTALVRSLGADEVIDYKLEDFTRKEARYDVVFDTVGKVPVTRLLNVLTKNGVLLLGASGLSGMMLGLWTSLAGTRKVFAGVITETAEDLHFIKELIEAGKMKAVIDRSYPLEQMAAAHEYVEGGHKKGNVAIVVAS